MVDKITFTKFISPVAQSVEQLAVTGMGLMGDRRRYSDRREYLIQAVQKRRKKVREMALDFLGGKCSRCGYDRCAEALEIHHLDSAEKDFGISSKGYTRSWNRIRMELDKCELLCANCHREVHAKLQLSAARRIVKSGEFREA